MTSRPVWANRYAVFDEIASGGMASVFLACRLGAGDGPRVVAVKKLFEQFAKQPEFVTMFLDEAHIAARIRHPNVVSTYEFLRVPDSLAIVMEFVLGLSLVDLSRIQQERGTAAPVDVSVAVLCDALEGLHAAHEATDEHDQPFGLVHRDMSPHNILVGKDGVGRVIDFGIAKAAGRLQVTEVGVMKGKFAYMAPEQIRAGHVDRRVDVYSAGIVLWEVLTGRPLFRGSADAELFSRRGSGTVSAPPPSSVVADLPPGLDAVVLRALAVDPDRRFSTALEMAQALRDLTDIAPQEKVAKWVIGLAGSRLRELEAKRNEAETSFAAGELAGLASALAPPSHAAAQSTTLALAATQVASNPVELDIPDLVAPVSSPSLPKPAPSAPSVRSTTTDAAVTGPTSKRRPSPTESPFGDPFGDGGSSGAAIELAVPMAPVPPTSSPSLSRRGPVTYSKVVRARPSAGSRGPGWIVLVAAMVAAGVAAVLLGPAKLKGILIHGSAARGYDVGIESVGLRSGGITLSGVTVSLDDVSGITLNAATVDVDLDWQGGVRAIAVPGFDLAIRGAITDVTARVSRWHAKARSRPPLAFSARSGHVVWTDAVASGLVVEGLDASIVGGPEEGAVHLEVPSLTVALPRGSLGPWATKLDATADGSSLTVALDRANVDGGPRLSLTTRPNIGSVLSIAVPRTKLVQVGLPLDIVGAVGDPEFDLSVEAQAMPTGEPITARAKLSLFGATGPAQGAPPVDLTFEGSVSGDSREPLHIEAGSLVVGKTRARLTGIVSLANGGLRVEVDRPGGKPSTPPSPFVLDTRDWTNPSAPRSPAHSTPVPAPPPAGSQVRRH